MATYKVIQDIEAEDKILGPLTLRQFIYGGIAAICLYLSYLVVSKGFAFMVVVFLPVALFTGFFAFPWGRDQPTEVWALAKVRFILKPRRRIWDQSAIKELVTVTAPKRDNVPMGKGLSENEVTSRLRALADTLDSRGWAIKNANINMGYRAYGAPQNSDRLIAPTAFAQAPAAEVADIRASDDILDEQNNPVAQHVNSMIEASSKAHRQKLMDSLSQQAPPKPAAPAQPKNDYWFLNQPAQPANVPSNKVTFNTQVVTPGMGESDLPAAAAPGTPTVDERALVQQLDTQRVDAPLSTYYGHMHKIQPLSAQKPAPAPAPAPAPSAPVAPPQDQSIADQPIAGPPPVASQAPTAPVAPQVTPAQQAAILQLANNDDLNVATLAREAQRSGPQDEVVIKLH